MCPKSFPTPGDLRSHMYVHTGQWPYRCTVCNRGFAKQTNLKNHMNTHTGQLYINVLTLNVLYHTIPHDLCGCEVNDVHGLQNFVSTHYDGSGSVLFILCLQQQRPLTSAFSKQISVICVEEWVLVCKLFTTATKKLRVNTQDKGESL